MTIFCLAMKNVLVEKSHQRTQSSRWMADSAFNFCIKHSNGKIEQKLIITGILRMEHFFCFLPLRPDSLNQEAVFPHFRCRLEIPYLYTRQIAIWLSTIK